MIITIDGPSGTGKSTIAKLLAEKLGFVHFDTGAMYRSLTYGVIKYNVDPDDEAALKSLLDNFDFGIEIHNSKKRYFFEGEDITVKIRETAVTSLVSKVSAVRIVREKLVEIQRQMAEGNNAVFEGRDMGTVVFPLAELKIFLTARPEIRANRRHEEVKDSGQTYQEVLDSVVKRDNYDSTRKESPLKQAEDAHVIDTSDLTIEEVLENIINIYDVSFPL